MQSKITKRTVDAAQPQQGDTFIWDTETKGFGLKVTPAGKRVYILQTRVDGRLRRITIGKHGSPWTPDTARNEAVLLLGSIASGIDPTEARAKTRQDLSVAQLCDLYLAEGCTTKKSSTIAMDRSRIEAHVKPLLGSKALRALTRVDVERLMTDIATGKTSRDRKTGARGRSIVRGGRGVASRTVGMLGAIMEFAVSRNLRSDNPVRGIKKYKDRKKERFLTSVELAHLGEALTDAEAHGANQYAIAAIRLLVLTGCRKQEILSLRWDYVDVDRGLLNLPDSKSGRKAVPLGAPALELLASLPRMEGSPFVFPGMNGGAHLIGLQKVWQRVRKSANLDDVRLHDLRHSFASVGAASGDSIYVIGKLLGHKQAMTTQRYAHLADDPLRAAAERISGQISVAMKGSKGAEIVRLRD